MSTSSLPTESTDSRAVAEPPAKSTGKTIIAGIVALAAVVVGGIYYFRSLSYESTDNAFLEGNIVQVSPRVSGQVLKVYVQDNQHVNKGDLLVELDPADYETKLAEAKARLDTATAATTGADTGVALTSWVTNAGLTQADGALRASRDQVDVLRSRMAQEEAGVKAAQAGFQQAEARRVAATAEAERAAADAKRYEALFKKDEVSRQQLDRALTDARATAANRDAATEAIAGARAQLAQAQASQQSTAAMLRQAENQVHVAEGRLKEAQAAPRQVDVRRADAGAQRGRLAESEASVKQAELNRGYTKIYASESGVITRKSVEPGNFVGAGQVLFALVSDRYWVIANFKETQLAKMRPGQEVDIKVDAYPGLKLQGKVDSIQAGTGARFSLMPPENATGNYVKVVQRVPVKIVLTGAPPAEYRLGPGMSVEPEVKVQ